MANAPATSTRTLTFNVGGEVLGMAASLVQEVVPVPRLARLPLAPHAMMGIAQIRGVIVPVLSAARLLGREQAEVQRVIVTEMDGPVGLAVTGVSRIVDGEDAAAVMPIDLAALVADALPERQASSSTGRIVAATAEMAIAATDAIALVAFVVGGQEFALPLAVIDEVLRLPGDIARMPHADAAALGTIASRGSVMPVMSLSALLALPVAPSTARSRIVVVRIASHRVGLVVDAMRSIERVLESDVDAFPQVLNRGGGEARIQAICRLDGGERLLSVLAPDQLVDEGTTARLRQSETEGESTMTSSTDKQDERFLLFRIGDESFCFPIEAVLEVAVLPPRLTPLPKAPAFVQGVMNVRGLIIPIIDQARRFNGSPLTGAKPRVIIVQIGELIAGFIVDSVSQVVQLGSDALRPAPDLGNDGSRVFDRVASIDGEGGLVLIASPQELLDRAERDLLLALGSKKAAKIKP